MKALLIVVPALLLSLSSRAVMSPDPPEYNPSAEAFAQALAAARDNDWDRLEHLEEALGHDHPLRGYLDFHRLRAALPDIPATEVRAWQTRHADLPLSQAIENVALSRYGRVGDWQAINALRDQPPYRSELQCIWWRARYQQDRDAALAGAARIWLSGHSLPDTCDALFDLAVRAGVIDNALIFERASLAFRENNAGLMRYLHSLLDSHWRPASSWLQRLHRQPEAVLNLPDGMPGAQRQALTAAALHRMADTDTPAALEIIQRLDEHRLTLEEAARTDIEHRIAWFSIVRALPETRHWLNNWLALHGTPELLEQRARRAVIEQDWSGVSAWVTRLPMDTQADARWQYWLGRAWQERGETQLAGEAWQRAADQRNFWGFLAADQLGQAYRLNDQTILTSAVAANHPALVRIRILRQAGEPELAMNEWRQLIRHSDADSVSRYNAHALQSGWYEMTVQGALQAGRLDALAWRFPAAYRDSFMARARALDADPWLMMAVARRESAFNPLAVSPAGALGLMQLMPGTARQVSRWLGQRAPSRESLFDVETSIHLGGTYLATLLERYQGNRLLALAAYNAGPHRVDRWLEARTGENNMPHDVWIESIPFHETRNYVQAVLTYRALLTSLADNSPDRHIRLLHDHERESGYGIALRPVSPMDQTGMELAQR